MPFTLIKGTYLPAAGIPDGDSVRFAPDDVNLMRSIPRVRMRPNAETVQLRYEGIDALEKHAIQPYAMDARDANLRFLGTNGPDDNVGSRGYIVTREGDQKAGRPVCFAFVGDADEEDGYRRFYLTSTRVRDSVNYKLIAAGMAYPLFYETLFRDLRVELAAGLADARANNRGYIDRDESGKGVNYTGPYALGTLPPIFPKLFRRLDEWNGASLQGFIPWLDQNDDERVHTLSDGRFIGFQDALEVKGDQIRLLYKPEDMVFRAKPYGPQPG